MIYSVKSGDSLSKIARDILGNVALWPEIARLNNIAAPYVIQPGQQLTLPDTGAPRVVSPPLKPIAPAPVSRPPIATPSAFNIVSFLQKNYLWVAGGIGTILLISLLGPVKSKKSVVTRVKRLRKRSK